LASGERTELGSTFADDEKAEMARWKGTSLQTKEETTKEDGEVVVITKPMVEYNYVKEDTLFGLKFKRLAHTGSRVLESIRPGIMQDELGDGRAWTEDLMSNCVHKKSQEALQVCPLG
jgi:hypothetical protein